MLSKEFLSVMYVAKPKSAHSMQAGQGNTGWAGLGEWVRMMGKGRELGVYVTRVIEGERRQGYVWVWAVGKSVQTLWES